MSLMTPVKPFIMQICASSSCFRLCSPFLLFFSLCFSKDFLFMSLVSDMEILNFASNIMAHLLWTANQMTISNNGVRFYNYGMSNGHCPSVSTNKKRMTRNVEPKKENLVSE